MMTHPHPLYFHHFTIFQSNLHYSNKYAKIKEVIQNHSFSVSIKSAKSAGAHLALPLPFWLVSSTMKHWSNASIATP